MLDAFTSSILPVALLVGVGWVARRRWSLDPGTLARVAYYVLVPAFVFVVVRSADTTADEVGGLIGLTLGALAVAALVGWLASRALGASGRLTAAIVLVSIYGNVGNFGLPVIVFRFGESALDEAAVSFLLINFVSFVVGVTAATWHTSTPLVAVRKGLTSPAVLGLVPALVFAWRDWRLPGPVEGSLDLLAGGMIPVMLLALGGQLADMRRLVHIREVAVASGIRLLVAPAAAAVFAAWLGVTGLARDVGIIQAAMPAAVFTAIIAIEHDLEPDFVTSTVVLSTAASLVTLTAVLSIV